MRPRIAIIGDGGWGTTVSILLSKKGYDVTLWGAFPDYIDILRKTRLNQKFLPGIKIPQGISLTADIDEVPKDALTVIAVPTKYLRDVVSRFEGRISGKVISLTKGIECESLKRPSEIIGDILGIKKLAVLSGPSISFEVARDLPTTVVVAAADKKFAEEIQRIFATPTFRVYTSSDIKGVELGGALKNIIAIAAGISDGMGLGVNTKAAILTRGLVEIARLGVKMGAKKETFFGLSGLGDLATTCISQHSRNRWLGENIAKGKKLNDILKKTEMVVEGVTCAKSAYRLSKKFKAEMPITEKIYEVLYQEKNPKEAVKELMSRSPKRETV